MKIGTHIFGVIGASVLMEFSAKLVKAFALQAGASDAAAFGWYGFIIGVGSTIIVAWTLHAADT